MAAQLLRLRWSLLVNGIKRSPGQAIGQAIVVLYALGLLAVILFLLLMLHFVDAALVQPWLVVLGSATVLGFAVLPLLFGVDDALDPRKFSLFGISTGRLSLGLLAGALLSVPSVCILIVSFGTVLTWSREPGATLVAVLAAALVSLSCIVLARVSSGLAGLLLSSRGAREAVTVAGVLLIVLLPIVLVLFIGVDWGAQGFRVLEDWAAALAWTPLGLLWAAPADAAQGLSDLAWTRLGLGALFLALLLAAWFWIVKLLLVTPLRGTGSRQRTGIGWFAWAPATPAGAIAARSFVYWWRDPRYRISLLIVPVAPALMLVPLLIAGAPWQVLVLMPVPMMCLFLGWVLHNDIAYDYTAFWLHVASGTSGRDDRLGRIVPPLVLGLPLIVIGSLLCGFASGEPWLALGIAGVSVALLGVGLGASSVMSVLLPYPAVRPGDNVFQQPQGTGAMAVLAQAGAFFIALLLSAAPGALLLLGRGGSPWWQAGAFACGLVIGIGACWLGVRYGGRLYQRRAPEVLATVLRG